MNNPKFQLFQSTANSHYYFRLRATNGEIILSSQGYSSKQGATTGIASVKVNAPIDERYERKGRSQDYTFNLKASNGEIIGRSETYLTSASRENGIAAVKRDAPGAPTEDIT